MRKLPLRWKASNGARLVMRQMRANDAASVNVSLNKLSPLARRYRFFGPVREFTDQMVTRLVDVDPAREYALLVLRRTDGQEIPIGGGRFVIDASGNDCEFSLVVGDEWQGQRIGRHILRALIHEASRRGLNQMRGDVLSENAAMIALVQARALGRHRDDAEGTEWGRYDGATSPRRLAAAMKNGPRGGCQAAQVKGGNAQEGHAEQSAKLYCAAQI